MFALISVWTFYFHRHITILQFHYSVSYEFFALHLKIFLTIFADMFLFVLFCVCVSVVSVCVFSLFLHSVSDVYLSVVSCNSCWRMKVQSDVHSG